MIRAAILDDEIRASSLLQHKLSIFGDTVEMVSKGDGGVVELIDGSEIEVSASRKSILMDHLFSL